MISSQLIMDVVKKIQIFRLVREKGRQELEIFEYTESKITRCNVQVLEGF